jgi:hypothetical protein
MGWATFWAVFPQTHLVTLNKYHPMHWCTKVRAHVQPSTAEKSFPERFRDDAEQAEDEDAGPRVEDGEDGVEVDHLLVRVTDEGGVGEPPGHAEDERHQEESGALESILSISVRKKIQIKLKRVKRKN